MTLMQLLSEGLGYTANDIEIMLKEGYKLSAIEEKRIKNILGIEEDSLIDIFNSILCDGGYAWHCDDFKEYIFKKLPKPSGEEEREEGDILVSSVGYDIAVYIEDKYYSKASIYTGEYGKSVVEGSWRKIGHVKDWKEWRKITYDKTCVEIMRTILEKYQ